MTVSAPYLVCEELKRRIVAKVYESGHKLSENAVAAEFNVGKTPAREALVMLTREGYLICKPRSGYYIAPIVESEQAEIREARFAIESAAIRLIMRKRGKSSADELLATVRLSQTEDEHYARKNYYFHSKLGELTGNEQLRRIITDLVAKSLIPPDQIETGPDGSRRNYHTLICEAMADLDVDAAIYHLRCDILGEDFSYLV